VTRPGHLTIDHVVVDGGTMSPNDAERFRAELRTELGRLLQGNSGVAITSESQSRVEIRATGERVSGARIARSIVQALSRP